jgi:hypothetical protein
MRPVRPPERLPPAQVPLLRGWPPEVPVDVGVRHPRRVTQRLGNALRAREAVWALSNQASTLLREQLRPMALVLLPIGVAGTSSVILTDTVRQCGAARVGA